MLKNLEKAAPLPDAVRQDRTVRTRPVAACYLCGSPGRTLYEGLCDRLFGTPGTWSFRKCSDPGCGLVWLDPIPIEEDLWKAYVAYYTHDDLEQAPVSSIKTAAARNLVRCLNLLLLPFGLRRKRFLASTMYLAGTRPGRALEVGCGSGIILDRLRKMGWQVQGVEMDPAAAALARSRFGLEVREGTLAQAGFDPQSFDAVVLSHMIEHVYDPVALLRECRRLLKDGGCLLLVTPNPGSLGHALFGRDWRGLEPPRHLHLVSPVNLREIARRAGFQGGLDVWTSAAHAESIFLASAALAGGGMASTETFASSLRMTLRSFLFQARELIVGLRQSDSGEEVVLKVFR